MKWWDDPHSKKARAEGQVARSVYKLEEIDRRWRLLRQGGRVLDLGAAPGSWTKYACQKIGRNGHLVALDLKPLGLTLPQQARFIQADIFAEGGHDLGPAFDVILSDMAPNTMGDHGTDALRSQALCDAALAVAQTYGKQGSHVVLKVLEGGETPSLVQTLRQTYNQVERFRPKATRRHSTELFLIGLGRK